MAIVLAGDSHFKVLKQFTKDEGKQNFCFQDRLVHFQTRSGMAAPEAAQRAHRAGDVNAELVILHIGSNDCCLDRVSADFIRTNIWSAINAFLDIPSVKRVVFSEIFHRDTEMCMKWLPFMRADYNSFVDEVNDLILEDIRVLQQSGDHSVAVWRHPSLQWGFGHDVLTDDGCHLNRLGLRRLYFGIRRAIVHYY